MSIYSGHRLTAIQAVMARIPSNRFRIPFGFYRWDLLDIERLPSPRVFTPQEFAAERDVDPELEATSLVSDAIVAGLPTSSGAQDSNQSLREYTPQDLEPAFVYLDFSCGFPVISDTGAAYWEHLPGEPAHFFDAFTHYLHVQPANQGVRTLFGDICQFFDPDEDVRVVATMFQWEQRAHAFELFQAVKVRRETLRRVREQNESAWGFGKRLLDKAEQFLQSEEAQILMTPKVALDMARLGWQMQRAAAGLSATGAPSDSPDGNLVKLPGGAIGTGSLAGDNEQFISDVVAAAAAGRDDGDEAGAGSHIIDQVLEDEDSASIAQELAMRILTKGQA